MSQLFENEKWIEENFGAANFTDKRLNSRLQKITKGIIIKPSASIPEQMSCWKDAIACYRFLNNEHVTHKRIQETHIKKVKKEAGKRKNKVILFPQDGSEIEVQKSTSGAGPIGNHTCQGIMMHTCLAVEYHDTTPQVIGLANQYIWEREDVVLSKNETRNQRNKRKGKESDYWLKTLKRIGPPPEDSVWVSIGDRGNDIYEFFSGLEQIGWDAVVRASQNRLIEVNGEPNYIMSWLNSLPVAGHKMIEIRKQGETKAREIITFVSYGRISLNPPARCRANAQTIVIDVVRCFNEEEGIDWILYSTIPINSFEDALEKIDWYACRWIIEEYHKCLKTGCKIESNQFETIKPVEALLGLLSIVALLLLQMKHLARIDDGKLAKEEVDPIVLAIVSKKCELDQEKLTIKGFWRAVAQLGGFLGRKSDGDPGWQTLWRGWLRVFDMWAGALIFKSA